MNKNRNAPAKVSEIVGCFLTFFLCMLLKLHDIVCNLSSLLQSFCQRHNPPSAAFARDFRLRETSDGYDVICSLADMQTFLMVNMHIRKKIDLLFEKIHEYSSLWLLQNHQFFCFLGRTNFRISESWLLSGSEPIRLHHQSVCSWRQPVSAC